MAKEETAIAHNIMLQTSKLGARLWKNTRGLFYTKFEVVALIVAVKSGDIKRMLDAAKKLRQVKAGLLAEGAADLIGFRPVIVTPEMVGSTIAVFSVVEVKTETGAASPEQRDFIDFVLKSGGFAGVARSPDEAKKILKYPID